MGRKQGVPHVGDFCARFESVLVDRTGVEDESNAFTGMEEHDRAGGPSVVSQELYGRTVVGVVCEVKTDFVRGLCWNGHGASQTLVCVICEAKPAPYTAGFVSLAWGSRTSFRQATLTTACNCCARNAGPR